MEELKGYEGKVLLVGANYGWETKEYECVIGEWVGHRKDMIF